MSRKVVNGVWYEVCVSQDGEIRDVIVESSAYDAERRADTLARQWPDCDLIQARKHTADPKRGPGASKFSVILNLDFRTEVANVSR